mgnify:CR=1 FL=1
MARIGILGGSFNPPHKGHLHISYEAKKRLALNQVWWLPTLQNPLKKNIKTPPCHHRLNQCYNAISDKNNFIKIKNFKYFYAIDLVEKLNKKYRHYDFYWLMGADNIANLHKWHNYNRFLRSINIAIFARNNDLLYLKKARCWQDLKKTKPNIFLNKKVDICSTQLRQD